MDQGEVQEYKALEEAHMDHIETCSFPLREGSLLAFVSLQVVSWGPSQITWKEHICRTCWQWAPEEERSSLGTATGVSMLSQGLRKVAVMRKRRPPCSDISLVRRAAVSQRAPGVEHPSICSECRTSFSQTSNLLKHHHIHTELRPYTCSECGKAFSQSSNLLKRHRVHTGLRPNARGECRKLFRDSSTCTKHQFTHSGLRPHVCVACGKSFSQHGHFLQHQWAHAAIRPYSCGRCGKRFGQSSNLATHTGEKPYRCGQRGPGFSGHSNLIKHRRIHSREQPYRCSQCGESFRFQPQLVQHQKHHVEKLVKRRKLHAS